MEPSDFQQAGIRPRIAVVVPAFNPTDRLLSVLGGLPPFVDIVVVVDDGSKSPVSVPADACARTTVVVRHDRNRGVGAAIVTGYRECRARGIEIAVVMGADDQMDPADLGRLIEPVESGAAAYAKGDRLSHRDCGTSMPLARRFGNSCLTFLTRLVTALPLVDSQCGYTAIRVSCLDRLPLERLYPRYGFPNDILAALSGAGLPVVDVAVRPVYRDEPSGINPGTAALVYPLILVRSVFTRLIAWSYRFRSQST